MNSTLNANDVMGTGISRSGDQCKMQNTHYIRAIQARLGTYLQDSTSCTARATFAKWKIGECVHSPFPEAQGPILALEVGPDTIPTCRSLEYAAFSTPQHGYQYVFDAAMRPTVLSAEVDGAPYICTYCTEYSSIVEYSRSWTSTYNIQVCASA